MSYKKNVHIPYRLTTYCFDLSMHTHQTPPNHISRWCDFAFHTRLVWLFGTDTTWNQNETCQELTDTLIRPQNQTEQANHPCPWLPRPKAERNPGGGRGEGNNQCNNLPTSVHWWRMPRGNLREIRPGRRGAGALRRGVALHSGAGAPQNRAGTANPGGYSSTRPPPITNRRSPPICGRAQAQQQHLLSLPSHLHHRRLSPWFPTSRRSLRLKPRQASQLVAEREHRHRAASTRGRLLQAVLYCSGPATHPATPHSLSFSGTPPAWHHPYAGYAALVYCLRLAGPRRGRSVWRGEHKQWLGRPAP
jgi:hypothetical protein